MLRAKRGQKKPAKQNRKKEKNSMSRSGEKLWLSFSASGKEHFSGNKKQKTGNYLISRKILNTGNPIRQFILRFYARLKK